VVRSVRVDSRLSSRAEQGALGVEHVEEIDFTRLVALACDQIGIAGELGGSFQGVETFGGTAAGDERVFGFRESGEHGAAVVVDGLLLGGAGGLDVGADAAGVEDRRGEARDQVGGGGFRIEHVMEVDGIEAERA
jgi:hypothetical protein